MHRRRHHSTWDGKSRPIFKTGTAISVICSPTFPPKVSVRSKATASHIRKFKASVRRIKLNLSVNLTFLLHLTVIFVETFLRIFAGASPHPSERLDRPSPDPIPPFTLPSHFQNRSGACAKYSSSVQLVFC